MRSGIVLLLVLALAPARGWADSKMKREASAADTACDSPPCSKEELQRAEKHLIKRLQRANMLAAEADYRGEKENAARLHRVFVRNFARRREVTAAIQTAQD